MGSDVLIDTSAVSHIIKGTSVGNRYLDKLKNKRVFYSFITGSELDYWKLTNNMLEWNARLDAFLSNAVYVPSDPPMGLLEAKIEKEILDKLERKPRALRNDLWIVASALRHNLCFMTHDCELVKLIKKLDTTKSLEIITLCTEDTVKAVYPNTTQEDTPQ